MSGQHEFDEEEAKRLEAIYTTPSATERRQLVRDRLDLQAGEAVISIGCGPGFEPAELAQVVGETGRVLGIDVSEAMLSFADGCCSAYPQVTLEQGMPSISRLTTAASLQPSPSRYSITLKRLTGQYPN